MTREPTDADIEYAERWMRQYGIDAHDCHTGCPSCWTRDFCCYPMSIKINGTKLDSHYSSRSAAVAALAVALAECREACAVKGETT